MTYDTLCDGKILFYYLLECRRGVHWKHSVQVYSLYGVANVAKLSEKMKRQEWNFAPYKRFTIRERGKIRNIQAASMEERIVQKALCREFLIPLLSKNLIFDNGATIRGKGIGFSRKRVIRHLRDYYSRFGCDGYVLQIDIKGYFAGIDHEILARKLFPLIKDKRIRNFISCIVEKNGKGLGLGSEASQILAAWFLSKIDHWCKEIFRIRHYARYMDDIYLIHLSKLYLAECLEKIRFMLSTLRLSVNERKTRITPLKRGFTFLKVHYTLSESGKIRKRYGKETGRRVRRKLRKLAEKKTMPVTIRNEYLSWRKAMKKFDADCVIKSCDASYKNYVLGGQRWN